MRHGISRSIQAIGMLFCLYLPTVDAALVEYQLTFSSISGPSGSGFFTYDATPGMEQMSNIDVDFGPGLRGTIITEYDPAAGPPANADAVLFGIFSDTPAGIAESMHIGNTVDDAFLLGITPLIDGPGFSWIDFGKNMNVITGSTQVRLDGPFYVFSGPGFSNDYYYGRILLSEASTVPLPATLWLFSIMVAGFGARRIRRSIITRPGTPA